VREGTTDNPWLLLLPSPSRLRAPLPAQAAQERTLAEVDQLRRDASTQSDLARTVEALRAALAAAEAASEERHRREVERLNAEWSVVLAASRITDVRRA